MFEKISLNNWERTTDKFAQVLYLENELVKERDKYSDISSEFVSNIMNLFPSYWIKPVDPKYIKTKQTYITFKDNQEFKDDYTSYTPMQFRFSLISVLNIPNMYNITKDKFPRKGYNTKAFSILYNTGDTRYPDRIINMSMIEDILKSVPIIYNEDGTVTDEINDKCVSTYISTTQNEIIREALPDLFETVYMIPQIDGINNGKVSGVTNIQDIQICIGEKFDATGRVKRTFLNLDKILTLTGIYRYYKANKIDDIEIDLIMLNIIYGFSANIYAYQKLNMPKYIVDNTMKVLEAVKLCADDGFLTCNDYLDKQLKILNMIK